MVNAKKKAPPQPVKTRQSTRRKAAASEIIRKPAEAPKPAKPSAAKPSKKSAVTKPPAKGKSTKAKAPLAGLKAGDQVPPETLEIKVWLDNGQRTTLGEQLESCLGAGLLIFVYSKPDEKALNFAYGFEEMDYDYQNVEAWRIGLTPSSVSANTAWKKKNTALTNPLLSDPNSSLLKALNFSLTKGNNRVGFALIDKERNVLARKYGRLDSVGMHLDDAICAFMGPRVLKDEDVEELRD